MLREVLDCILEEVLSRRRLFHYYPGREAVELLCRRVGEEGCSVAELKKGHLGRLLEREPVRSALAGWSDGWVSQNRLNMLQPPYPYCFRLNFLDWGCERKAGARYCQLSRPGWNLVIQLNFDSRHWPGEPVYSYDDEDWDPAEREHPSFWYTLAWARVDISRDLDVALIEELQSDWYTDPSGIRLGRKGYEYHLGDCRAFWYDRAGQRRSSTNNTDLCYPYWSEAMLLATIQLLWQELGISRIFYHTWETGKQLKHCNPPRSVYSRLPRRFCFQLTREHPPFLAKRLRRMRKCDPQFYLMEG